MACSKHIENELGSKYMHKCIHRYCIQIIQVFWIVNTTLSVKQKKDRDSYNVSQDSRLVGPLIITREDILAGKN